jgi:hypothetical protein
MKKVLDSFRKSVDVLKNVANMTSSKLSLNQNIAMKTKSMEQNFQRSKAADFGNSVPVTEGNIAVPPLCESMGVTGDACSNLKVTSQVS